MRAILKANGQISLFIGGGIASPDHKYPPNNVNTNQLNTLVYSRIGNTVSYELNGGGAVTMELSGDLLTDYQFGDAYVANANYPTFFQSIDDWDGTEADAIAQGWTINGNPETTTEAFTSPSITLGDGYAGELADIRLYDSAGNLLEQFHLNDHTDTAANGLNGKSCIGLNGAVGTYNGCAAVVQEGIDKAVSGLAAYGEKTWFDGTDDRIQIPYTKTIGDGFTHEVSFVFNEYDIINFRAPLQLKGSSGEEI